MFKRANKITALLVAAASVMSVVPAMAADSTRLGIKDGTIESAVAFDGKYIYEGYKTSDDDKSIYYNDGSKDKELTDYDDYTFTTTRYADKYIVAVDDSDEYLVDLSSGKILDDTIEDKMEGTASALEKALNKADKYESVDVTDSELTQVASSAKFQEPWYTVTKNSNVIFTDAKGKYVDSSVLGNIYAYSTQLNKVVKVEKFNKAYTDTKLEVDLVQPAKVIAQDKDFLYAIVNVDIKDTATAAASTSVKSVATVDLSKAKYETTPTVVSGVKDKYVITYGSGDTVTVGGNVYTEGTDSAATVEAAVRALTAYDVTVEAGTGNIIATAKTTGVVATPAITGTSVARTLGTDDTAGTPAPATFVVAGTTFIYDAASGAGKYKDQADLKNKIIAQFALTAPADYTFDAATLKFTATVDKTSSDVTTDLGTNVTVKAGHSATSGERTTNAWYLQKISKAQGDKDEEAYLPKEVVSYQIDNKSLYDSGDVNDAYGWLIDGSDVADFVNVQVKDSALYAYKLDGSNKLKVLKLDLKKIKENPINKDTTAEFGTTKLDGYVVKKDGDSDQDFDAYSRDVNGVIWVLNNGKIIKFDGKDKTTVYTCDSGMENLDVYDAKNLIAWNEDDERYTTVTEGTEVTQGESTAVAPVIVTGWVKGTDGTWTFNDVTGTKVAATWINVGGAWYYMKADGIMATGWIQDGATWYYLKSSGAMATGWLNDNGTWYYLAGSGAMLANTTVDGYVLGASGAWIK